jgi:hypothetical protein
VFVYHVKQKVTLSLTIKSKVLGIRVGKYSLVSISDKLTRTKRVLIDIPTGKSSIHHIKHWKQPPFLDNGEVYAKLYYTHTSTIIHADLLRVHALYWGKFS